MSRTYRKSYIDISRPRWISAYPDDNWIVKRNWDGRSSNRLWEIVKEHSNYERRANDRKIINDFKRGVDPDEIEYCDDRNLRYIIWNYD